MFAYGNAQFLSRAWLLDRLQTQASAAAKPSGPNEPWNGEFYCSYWAGETRSWEEAVKYGFICAGSGVWYTWTLQLPTAGAHVWVNAPGYGYVGVCRVKGESKPTLAFLIRTKKVDQPALDVLKDATYHRKYAKNKDTCEYFVPVQWLQTVELDHAVNEIGLFDNQNTICLQIAPKCRYLSIVLSIDPRSSTTEPVGTRVRESTEWASPPKIFRPPSV